MPAHRFLQKLKGAKARLFAAVCEHYIGAVNDECNDTPEEVPLFSCLSPQQRLSLVKDLIIGLLCEDEPLPPNTIQHGAAYVAMLEVLFTEIEVEYDNDEWHELRKELVDIGEEFQCQREPDHLQLTEKEEAERKKNWDVVEARAERNKQRLEHSKNKAKNKDEFKVEEREFSTEFMEGMFQRFTKTLFNGPPIPKAERKSLLQSLDEDERSAFYWRILADETLQENTHSSGFFPPLCNVDFDWRCTNLEKWIQGLNFLLLTGVCEAPTETERKLVSGEINVRSYADPSQHARILSVKRNVKMLRAVHDQRWVPESVGDDQRCIWALSATEPDWTEDHAPWAKAFLLKCNERGFQFSQRGNYQKRFDIYKELKPVYSDSDALKKHFIGYHGCFPQTPIEYEDELTDLFIRCNGPVARSSQAYGGSTMSCTATNNLKQCSGCGVVQYCSRECQKNDWPNHKKDCKSMALLHKDKKQVAELAKKL